MMPREIVKVQVPLFGPGRKSDNILIYDKARQHMKHQSLSAGKIEQLAGAAKAFFDAEWNDDTGWTLYDRVADQTW